MPPNRIESHPILPIPDKHTIEFYWQGQPLQAKEGETIASALIANGYEILGHHPKDGSPLGLFCANGQCSQCLVLLDGKPVKACMTHVRSGISVMPADGLPDLTALDQDPLPQGMNEIQEIIKIPVLIIGGGPAGLSAANILGESGVKVLLIDDKSALGGKLVLQTHRFFGSTEAVYAGTRGIDIAERLSEQVSSRDSVEIWLETTAVAVYEEKTVGVWRASDDQYLLIQPDILLVATGARERSLPFKGNTLPGIYGAGAFQTLVNRDLVRPARNLFIIGGGNVGLIAGYHALQAGINLVGLVEALPECGGYKVHEDKLARFNVPILTSHTILEARGADHVRSVVVARVDDQFHPIQGTEREFLCDCVLVAVGLNPVDEFISKAREVGLPVYAAGDADEIAEASAAIISGKITGLEVAHALGVNAPEIPSGWWDFETILKSRPGKVLASEFGGLQGDVFPVMHCRQEIPCDPCGSVCPNNLIRIDATDIRHLPEFCPEGEKLCIACERCVAVCPGLAITLVDYRRDKENPTVSIPMEFAEQYLKAGTVVAVTDVEGHILGQFPVIRTRTVKPFTRTLVVRVQVPAEIAVEVAGIRIVAGWNQPVKTEDHYVDETDQDNIVCRCEHISADQIRQLIRNGVRDINQLKAATKATMGACGGKTCLSLIKKIFREEGISLEEVTDPPQRPVFVEVPLDILARNRQVAD